LYWLNKEIERDEERLRELYAAATDMSCKITGLPHAPGTIDKTALAVEIAYLKQVIEDKLKRCYAEYNKIMEYINGVDDSYIRQIMTLRYIHGYCWRKVAHHMGGGNTPDSVRMACFRYLNSH